MNCGYFNTFSCGGCHQPSSQNANKCCNSNLPVQLDPIYPAKTNIPTNSSNRKTTKTSKKLILPKSSTKKVDTLNDCEEICKLLRQSDDQTKKKKDLKNKNQKSNNDCGSTKNQSLDQSNTSNPNNRSNACQGQPSNLLRKKACGDCDKSDDMNESLNSSETGNSCTMVNSSNVKNLKNYNSTQIKEPKKASGDLDDITSSDNEVWLLQCPKDFDPQQMLCNQLGKQTKIECAADRFSEEKTLAIIAPEKAAEYQMICDSLKLVKPVGKIVFSEKYDDKVDNTSLESTKCSLPSQAVDCSQSTSAVSSYNSDECSNLPSDNDCDMGKPEPSTKSSCSKKMPKNFSDQKYSMEVTVKTLEKCKSRKGKKNSCDEICLVPLEPKLKKKNASKRDGCC